MSAQYHCGRVRARCVTCELRTPSVALDPGEAWLLRMWTDAHLMQFCDHEVAVEFRAPDAWQIFHSERARIDVRVVA